jgi:hypothetical protein
MCLRVSYKKNMKKINFFASLKSLKKREESDLELYSDLDTDPDPLVRGMGPRIRIRIRQIVTDPQHV